MSIAAVTAPVTSAPATPSASVIINGEALTPSIVQTPSSAVAPPPGINMELSAAAHKAKAAADGTTPRAPSPHTIFEAEDSLSKSASEKAITRTITPHSASKKEVDQTEHKESAQADRHLATAVENAMAEANAMVLGTSRSIPSVFIHPAPETAVAAPAEAAVKPEEEKKGAPDEHADTAIDVAEPLDQDLVLPTKLGEPTLCDRVTRVGQNVLLGGTAVGLLVIGAWSAATDVSSWLTGFAFAAGGLVGSYVVIDNTCGDASRSTKLFAAAVKGYATVTAQVGRLVGRTQKSEMELEAINKKYSELDAKLLNITVVANGETAKLQGTVDSAQKVEVELDGVVNGAKAVVSADAGVNNQLHNQIVDFATKVSGFKDDLNALDKDLPEMQALDQNMERSEASFAKAFANISSVFEALVSRMKDLNALKAKVVTLSTDLENLTAQIKEKEAQNTKLEGQIKGLDETLAQMTRTKGELEELASKLTTDIESLKASEATHEEERKQWASLLDAAQAVQAPAASAASAIDLTAVQQDLTEGDQLLQQLQPA